jgi:hypothetical protein
MSIPMSDHSPSSDAEPLVPNTDLVVPQPDISAPPNGVPTDGSLLEQLPGKLVFVGLTFLDADGELLDQFQTSGRVEGVDGNGMLELRQSDGSSFRLPADSDSIRPAGPGEYRVRHSGVRVLNPDFLGHFEVQVRRQADVERYRLGGFPPPRPA